MFTVPFFPRTPAESLYQPASESRELVLESSSKAFGNLNAFLYDLQETWFISDATFTHIHVSLCEAVMNAIIHGNRYRRGKRIFVEAKDTGSELIFTVQDEGSGFHNNHAYSAVENCLSSEARGIFMISHLSDSANYYEEGKCLELVFARKN